MTRRGWDWSAARALCLRQARGILGAGPDAEDAAQEALIRAWRMRENCRAQEAPEAWLISIARREALRVAARRREEPLEETAVAATPSHEVSALLRVDVGRAVAALPGDDRRLLGERYWAD